MRLGDTIIARSSACGASQRVVLRLSGPMALCAVGLQDRARGCFTHVLALPTDDEVLSLPTIALVARAPASFTGEDVVELLLPGSDALLKRVESTLHARCELRSAEPGEFTARAFFNGRIDLVQADGIAEAISAETDSQLRAAQAMASGALGEFIDGVREETTTLAALVEAGIDFTDQEDVRGIESAQLAEALGKLIKRLDDQLEGAVPMERLQQVPLVVLTGSPNAGKSSLFNALLGRTRMLVAPVAGTTRDVIREPLTLKVESGELEVMLADVAGVYNDDTPVLDPIESAMRRHALQAIDEADLVLRLHASDAAAIPRTLLRAGVIEVATKCDRTEDQRPAEAIEVSAHTGSGLDTLREAIASALNAAPNGLTPGRLALARRQESELRATLEALAATLELATTSAPIELLAAHLREGLNHLGRLSGRITPDAVLAEVFARFCIGK